MANNNHLWAFLFIALIAGVSIGFVVNNNGMTGDVTLPSAIQKTAIPLKTVQTTGSIITCTSTIGCIYVTQPPITGWLPPTDSKVCVEGCKKGAYFSDALCGWFCDVIYSSSYGMADTYRNNYDDKEKAFMIKCMRDEYALGKDPSIAKNVCNNVMEMRQYYGTF